MGGIDIEVSGFKNQDGFLAELSFDAAAPSSSLSVSIFFLISPVRAPRPKGVVAQEILKRAFYTGL